MKKIILAGFLLTALPQFALAEQAAAIAFSAGSFEVFDNDENAAEAGIECRFAPMASAFNLIPTVGVAMNADGGYWGYGGVRYDWYLSPKWVVTPNFAAAFYEQGGGADLGYDLEFRTGLDLGYQVSDRSRLSLGIYHMSNAELGEENPGSESVIFTYSYTPDF
jgi:hypothetical protein